MRNLVERYAEIPRLLRRPLWRLWHNYLNWKDRSFEVKFLNYGYADLDSGSKHIGLSPDDEAERFCINLYHRNLGDVQVEGKDLLEVGCGRGGGASYIMRYLRPRSYIGLDVSKRIISQCNRNYQIPGLSFACGKAESLPFETARFDAVVNVESSRCYSDMPGFLSEVHRVLKPSGFLFLSDMRTREGNAELREQCLGARFSILRHENILANVVKALELDNERRVALILEKTPKLLHKSVREFSGTIGSERFRLFREGLMEYHWYLLRKPDQIRTPRNH
jgi:ubiquinone/menaquinone biosynthesis C-methylase UbiE